ncbi:MAG: EAL domain-containing protein [Methylococcaceae bacterium]|nr:EAL domain-containing protein [Methylococcaceae bacterium]
MDGSNLHSEENKPVDQLKVLFCEGSELLRAKITRHLTHRLSDVIVAKNGKVGLELFKQHRPQVIISDIDMPEMNGLTMCQAIKEIDPNVFIIIISENNSVEHLHASIELGISKYLVKPINLTKLMDYIFDIATTIEKKNFLESKRSAVIPNALSEDDIERNKIQDYVNRYMKNEHGIDDIRNISIPLGEVNGDFHVVVEHHDSVYILVADGSGHGLSAIMPALQIPKTFKTMAQKGFSILAIADELNHILCEQNITEHFIASTLIQMDPVTGFIEVLNCGNPSALLINNEGIIIHEFKSNSLALGTVCCDHLDLDVDFYKYNEPAHLYAFTDGLVDSIDPFGSNAGFAAFKKILIEEDNHNRFRSLNLFIEDALVYGQADDITLLEVPFIKRSTPRYADITSIDSVKFVNSEGAGNESEILKRSTILHIDDEASQKEFNRCLERKVARIYSAMGEAEALSLFLEKKPSLIIINCDLAGINGLATIEKFKQMEPSVPVIVVSDSDLLSSTEQLFDIGVKKYLKKPLDAEKLLNVVKYCSQHHQQEQHLQLSSAVFFTSSLAMTITDKNKVIVSANPSFCKITGYSLDEVIGRNPKLLSSGKHDAKFYQAMWASINDEHEWSGEIWNRRKNGDLFLEWITINAITNAEGEVTHYFSVFSDITERRAAEEAIRKLTYHDPLTSLPNRRLFLDRLEQEIKKAERCQQRVAVLFVDLDNFKDVNDTLGHDMGDLVLQQAAVRLDSCIRDSDTVARFGGDEFTICLTELKSATNADTVAQNILKEMGKPFVIKDEKFYLSVSIGVTLYPDDTLCIPDLLKQADQAMFSAKDNGRNCAHFFKPMMQETALLRKETIKDLRIAIANNQFCLNYQPIIEMATGKIHKAEALIRWPHPTRGLISPVDFIPIAEDTGMIVDIGNWVFQQAVLQAKKWQKEFDHDIQISINKSPKQFQSDQSEHIDWINYLKDIELSSNLVVIEITEGLLMDTNSSNTKQLMTFRNAGLQIALDDFGTGYSSLSYLRKFDIDYLKIDRSFVSNLTESSDDLALCEAIIVMAHKLGIRVIAEGIETEEQRQLLLDAGCDFGQGYLFSKPMSSNDFEAYMKASLIK